MGYGRVPALRPGDTVAVVAPAGVPPRDELESGLAALRSRYDVVVRRDLAAGPDGALAGSDEVRRDELSWALSDPAVRCVVAARGGYGTSRILSRAALEALRRAPRAVVGFSDVTALLCGVLRHASLVAMHGPMVCHLGRPGKEAQLDRLVGLLERPIPPEPLAGLRTVVDGRATGPLVGGNLTVLAHLVGTGLLPDLSGALLLLEDVGERPYRLDRCLTQLRLSGALDLVAGVVVGGLVDCGAVDGELEAAEVIRRFLEGLGVPAVSGAQVGHCEPNVAVPLGVPAQLDASAGTLRFLEPFVS